MAEIDTSRSLEFERIGSGLRIRIPITASTPKWSAAVNRLAFEQHIELQTGSDRFLLLSIAPGLSAADVVVRLDQVDELVRAASQVESDALNSAAPLESAALEWWEIRRSGTHAQQG